MSAWTCQHNRQGRLKDRSTLSSNPMMEGPRCRFRREHEPASDIDSLKALDPDRPIREADIGRHSGPPPSLSCAIFVRNAPRGGACQNVGLSLPISHSNVIAVPSLTTDQHERSACCGSSIVSSGFVSRGWALIQSIASCSEVNFPK